MGNAGGDRRQDEAFGCRPRRSCMGNIVRGDVFDRRLSNRLALPTVPAAMTTSLGDLRLALRGLRRGPLFATVAIDQLVKLYQQGSHNGSNMGSRMYSYPIYQDFQKRAV